MATLEEEVALCHPDPFFPFVPGAAAHGHSTSVLFCSALLILDWPSFGTSYSHPARPKAGCENMFPGRLLLPHCLILALLVVKVILGFLFDLFCFLSPLGQNSDKKTPTESSQRA